MKIKLSKITFNLLSYLSDKTHGNAFVVKYKLLIGTFLLSATQATAQDIKTKDDNEPIRNERITCYKPAPSSYPRKGKIVSETNVPIKDVTITVKDSNLETQSDENGNFEIKARSYDTLVFSCDGYTKEEASVRDLINNNVIIMTPELPEINYYITCYDTVGPLIK